MPLRARTEPFLLISRHQAGNVHQGGDIERLARIDTDIEPVAQLRRVHIALGPIKRLAQDVAKQLSNGLLPELVVKPGAAGGTLCSLTVQGMRKSTALGERPGTFRALPRPAIADRCDVFDATMESCPDIRLRLASGPATTQGGRR